MTGLRSVPLRKPPLAGTPAGRERGACQRKIKRNTVEQIMINVSVDPCGFPN